MGTLRSIYGRLPVAGMEPYQILAHVAALTPLALLGWDIATDNLTVNPIQDITFRTGKWALILLVVALACTPINTLFGIRQALKLRRPLGLYGFLYVVLHFLTFTGLDYRFDMRFLPGAILEKRFVLAGLAALLLLIPLAVTSTKGWQKRLGKRWKSLHRLVYLAVPLAVVHYVWLVKADIREPLTYGAIVALLLALRLPPVRRQISNLRSRLWPRRERKPRHSPTPEKMA